MFLIQSSKPNIKNTKPTKKIKIGNPPFTKVKNSSHQLKGGKKEYTESTTNINPKIIFNNPEVFIISKSLAHL